MLSCIQWLNVAKIIKDDQTFQYQTVTMARTEKSDITYLISIHLNSVSARFVFCESLGNI